MTHINDKKHKPLEFPVDRSAFLKRAFEAPDGCVSVGGLAGRLEQLSGPVVERGNQEAPAAEFKPGRLALGRFVELSRRKQGLSVEQFAGQARLDPTDILQVEDEDAPAPEPRVIAILASFLKVDPKKFMVLAGYLEERDDALGTQAVRFAAWSHGAEPLTKDEEQGLAEFAKVIIESTE